MVLRLVPAVIVAALLTSLPSPGFAFPGIPGNVYDLPKRKQPKIEYVSEKPLSTMVACLNAQFSANPQVDISVPYESGRAILLGNALISVQPAGAKSLVKQWDGHIPDTYRKRTRSCR